MLVYGSSISRGIGTPYPTLNYINVAAEILGIDVLNKAISGGCYCEEKVKEYLLQEDFDFAYLELGTNLADRPEVFIRSRLGKFAENFISAMGKKKVFMMSPITGLSDVSTLAADYTENFRKTREIISEIAERFSAVVLLNGQQLLDKAFYLGADVLHPSDFGHVMMGIILADMLKPYMETLN